MPTTVSGDVSAPVELDESVSNGLKSVEIRENEAGASKTEEQVQYDDAENNTKVNCSTTVSCSCIGESSETNSKQPATDDDAEAGGKLLESEAHPTPSSSVQNLSLREQQTSPSRVIDLAKTQHEANYSPKSVEECIDSNRAEECIFNEQTDLHDTDSSDREKQIRQLYRYKETHQHIHEFIEAAAVGNIDTINRLVGSHSIDASVVTRAFKKAAEFGHVRVAERLLQEDGVKPDAQFNWAIRVAAANNHVELVDRLLRENSVDPTARSDWALVRAAERGHEAVVERLLQVPEVNAGARGNWSIIKAAENGHCAIVELLLQVPGVDPTAQDNEALKSAIRVGWPDVVQSLLKDDRVASSIDDFGKLFKISARAAVRRRLLAAMRESAVKAVLLVSRAEMELPDKLRQRILLYSHGIWLQGSTEEDKLHIIQRIMRRGRLARRML